MKCQWENFLNKKSEVIRNCDVAKESPGLDGYNFDFLNGLDWMDESMFGILNSIRPTAEFIPNK